MISTCLQEAIHHSSYKCGLSGTNLLVAEAGKSGDPGDARMGRVDRLQQQLLSNQYGGMPIQ